MGKPGDPPWGDREFDAATRRSASKDSERVGRFIKPFAEITKLTTMDEIYRNQYINQKLCKYTGGPKSVHITIPMYLYKTILATGINTSLFITLAVEKNLREGDILDGRFPNIMELLWTVLALRRFNDPYAYYHQHTTAGRTRRIHLNALLAYMKRHKRACEIRLAQLEMLFIKQVTKIKELTERTHPRRAYIRRRRLAPGDKGSESDEDIPLRVLRSDDPDRFMEDVREDPEKFIEAVRQDPELLEGFTESRRGKCSRGCLRGLGMRQRRPYRRPKRDWALETNCETRDNARGPGRRTSRTLTLRPERKE